MNGAPPGAAAANPPSHDGIRPENRSHLLRRSSRTHSLDESEEEGGIRLRRERRVNASFSGIPALARNGRR